MTSRLLQEVDLTRLSPKSKAIQILIGDQIPEGYKLNEIAEQLGQPPSWVSEKLADLRAELLAQAGTFPFALSDAEYQALKDDINAHGIQIPIVIGNTGLIDGRHRCLIWKDLGKENQPIPAIFIHERPEIEHELAWSLNATRRHLNQAQRRILVETELMRDRQRSDRWIARICGVNHVTVGTIRAEIIEAEHQEQLAVAAVDPGPGVVTFTSDIDRRLGLDGRVQTVPAPKPREQPLDRFVATVTCRHGEEHALMIGPDGHYLT